MQVAIAIVGSLGLHLLLGLNGSGSLELPGASGTRQAPALTVRQLAAAPPAAAAGPTTTATSTAPQPSTTGPAAPSRRTVDRRYFDSSEVDEPAQPVPDWQLDPGLLVINQIRLLQVEVLVSREGTPHGCRVTAMEPPKPALNAAIAQQICATRLTPALRRGVAVPSVRHIEILLDRQ